MIHRDTDEFELTIIRTLECTDHEFSLSAQDDGIISAFGWSGMRDDKCNVCNEVMVESIDFASQGVKARMDAEDE